jgi:hypothetical protein
LAGESNDTNVASVTVIVVSLETPLDDAYGRSANTLPFTCPGCRSLPCFGGRDQVTDSVTSFAVLSAQVAAAHWRLVLYVTRRLGVSAEIDTVSRSCRLPVTVCGYLCNLPRFAMNKAAKKAMLYFVPLNNLLCFEQYTNTVIIWRLGDICL